MNNYLREAMRRKEPEVKPAVKGMALDDCKKEKAPVFDSAADYTTTDITLKAVATVQQWVETDSLSDGESLADRLMAMVIGIADANKNGEVDEDEQYVIDMALNAIWDYLAKYGAADDDISALLNDWDSDAAERIRDLLASSLPEGDADTDSFVFGGDQEPALDAAYKKTIAVRDGKKTRINKRVSGHAVLSAEQKVAIKKARMKSHSATAQAHRAKSMKVRDHLGL